MRKLTTEEWIQKARAKHGDKYDYSQSVYVNSRTEVTIICPEHGPFIQRAGNHLLYGCPKCAGNVAPTNEEFIEQATKVHNGKYDYSKVDIKGAKDKITIICPIHGEFEQRYRDHLRGCGCNKCRLSKSKEFDPIEGKSNTREYKIWKGMKNRVTNPNATDADHYINRGIKCCDAWLESFEAFYNDMGPCPEGYSLDRIDNDGDYCPENCRWADAHTQTCNRGEFNDYYTHDGKTLVLKDWARELGINYNTLRSRIHYYGLTFEEAIQKDPFKKLIEINGEEHTLKEWSDIYGIKYSTVINRIHKHKWDVIRALTTPIRK